MRKRLSHARRLFMSRRVNADWGAATRMSLDTPMGVVFGATKS